MNTVIYQLPSLYGEVLALAGGERLDARHARHTCPYAWLPSDFHRASCN